MKVLVIPDVHLKPYMFERAKDLLKKGVAERAVCLMDIPDDWNKQFNIDAYAETYDAAIRFAKNNPETLWCYGNHDLCYRWNQRESGYSPMAVQTILRKQLEMNELLGEEKPCKYVQRIDNILFSHAGVSRFYVEELVGTGKKYDDVNYVLDTINQFSCGEMWYDPSPIWLRAYNNKTKMYKPRKFLQVVGHTPVERIVKQGSVIYCDTFSTFRDGTPIGTREFLVIDTLSGEYTGTLGTEQIVTPVV